jgi:hypothetical protein
MLNRDADRPALRIEIDHDVGRNLVRGYDPRGGKLEQSGVGVGKVSDFHGRAFRSKKAL